MKNSLSFLLALMITNLSFAQKDSSTNFTDTLQVGNFVIIKKNKGNTETQTSIWHDWDKTVDIKVEHKPRKKSNISTNWWIMDLGFANFRDETNYSNAQSGPFFKTFRSQDGPVNQNSYQLKTTKSSNVNIWFFMQKLNVYKHVLNLKYGLGYEMYNYRYDSRLSFRKEQTAYAYNDSISFSKNKLFINYLTVPFMVNINTSPDRINGFNFSLGMSAGYLINSRNKQISAERGKQKINGDFGFEPWRIATIAEIGLGPVRLYGSYSINKLQKDETMVDQYPYTVGIRFSRW